MQDKQIKRRDFIKMTAFCSVMFPFLYQAGCIGPKRNPNIIFILADDLGYGDLGCYGQTEIQTPYLDQMAAEGMRFTQHYAGSTVCAPSRCCLMTGLHTGHAKVRGNARGEAQFLRPQDITVAEILKQAGYTTALIGKWGLGEENSAGFPLKKGFDYFFGYLNQSHAHNYYPEFLWKNDQRLKLRNIVDHNHPYFKEFAGVSTNKLDYSHDMFTDEALSFIEQNQKNPFFLYLAYTIPHANNEAGKAGMEVPDYGIYRDKDWPDPQKGHAAMISRMDRDIGKLMAKLSELGLDENTLVLFSSDNGPHQEGGADPTFFDSYGPLRGIKRDLYEGGIRVPLIARWTGQIKAGAVNDHISAFWDFLPTCADLIGANPIDGIDGFSMLPTLFGEDHKQRKHDFLYWEFHERGSKQAIRQGDWKVIRFLAGDRIELYNLREDLTETTDIADQYPEMIHQMKTLFEIARTESEYWRLKGVGG